MKSLVTLTLTAVFAVMAMKGTISQDFMTVYTVVIAFYFGTQTQRAQRYAAALPAPDWAAAELQEAVNQGITDGTAPMQLIPRCQAAIMAVRAKKRG